MFSSSVQGYEQQFFYRVWRTFMVFNATVFDNIVSLSNVMFSFRQWKKSFMKLVFMFDNLSPGWLSTFQRIVFIYSH